MPFSAAGIGAILRSRGVNDTFSRGADAINQRVDESGFLSRNPLQNPNFGLTDDGQYDIQNMEGFALNELFDVRNNSSADTLRSLRNVGSDRKERVAAARNEAGQSADVTEGIFNRRTEGMGLSDRQRKGARQSFSLNRAVTEAAASSGTRRTVNNEVRQADQAISGFEDLAFGQQLGGLTGLANAEGQRRIRKANEKANKKANRNSMLGTLGGLAIGALSLFSAEEYKDQTQEAPKLLDKLKKVRIDKWKYKGSEPEHIGPYAEEFNETFGVGTHKDTIDVVSMLGVTIGSIKELNDKVEAALA